MNLIYNLIWNKRYKKYLPASEIAKAKGGGKKISSLLKVATFVFLGLFCFKPVFAQSPPGPDTLPEGGVLIHGQAQIFQSGKQMSIEQGSDKAILHWQSFDIGRDAKVDFTQPSKSSVALNRVVAGDASQIYGQLTANGEVWLINPRGMVFGQGSQVDVGGLVASSMDIGDKDFLDGKISFSRAQAEGRIENKGEIRAEGGLVALLAPEIINDGLISAYMGKVVMAGGDKITLDAGMDGMLKLVVDPSSVNSLIENRQMVKADGGQVIMTSKAANELVSSIINNKGSVQARTIVEKEGRILLLADMDRGEVHQAGVIDASAPVSGDGGFVEISAATVKVVDGSKVTTRAEDGQTGTWLIDPKDFTIAASGGDMTGDAVKQALENNDFEITTSTMGTDGGNGDIHLNDAVSWNKNKLTLTAERNININAVMTASDTAGLEMTTTNGDVKVGFKEGEGHGFAGRVDFGTRSGTGFLTINSQDYTVINTLGVENSTAETELQGMKCDDGKYYALGTDIPADATSGWNGGKGFKPIGDNNNPFQGTFNGLGHTITGLTISRADESNIGLFGCSEGQISNVGIENANIKGENAVGGLVGANSEGGKVFNSYVTGEVEGTGNSVGGLVGSNVNGEIIKAYTTGKVKGTGSFAGGLVGENGGEISESYATGKVDGSNSVGGLVGHSLSGGKISKSYATGEVEGTGTSVGGLVGSNILNSTISESYAAGDVTGGNQYVGGLVGWNESGKITNSYATGDVRGSGEQVGGLVGGNQDGDISNSYATGKVTGEGDYIGGLVGHNSGNNAVNSFWDIETSGQATYIGGGGRDTERMQKASTFTDWSISNSDGRDKIWRIYEGYTYPLLTCFLTPAEGVTIKDTKKTYDGKPYTGKVFLNNFKGDMNHVFPKADKNAINVGTYNDAIIIYSDQQGYDFIANPKGTLIINKAPVFIYTTIDGSLTGSVQKIYDGTDLALLSPRNYMLSGWAQGEGARVTKTEGRYEDAEVGTNKMVSVSLTYADYIPLANTNLNNYILPANLSGPVGIISPASLTISVDDLSKVYDGLPYSGPYSLSYSGFVNGEDQSLLSGSPSFDGSGIGAENAGNYSISVEGFSADNYEISYQDGNLSIEKAPLNIRAVDDFKNYDGQAYIGGKGVSCQGFIEGEDEGLLAGKLIYGGTSQGALNAGFYSIIPEGLTADNYYINYQEGSLEIARIPLLISANNALKFSNGLPYSGGNGVSYQGFIEGEDEGLLGGSLLYGGSSQGARLVGTYSIIPSGYSSENYSLSYLDGELAIYPIPEISGGTLWRIEERQRNYKPKRDHDTQKTRHFETRERARSGSLLSFSPGFIPLRDKDSGR